MNPVPSQTFIMCDSSCCPSRQACFRHADSGTPAQPGQRYGQFDRGFEWATHAVACTRYLPRLSDEGAVAFPLYVHYTLDAINDGSFSFARTLPLVPFQEIPELPLPQQRVPGVDDLDPQAALDRVEAGWEVPGFYASPREERLAADQRRFAWVRAHPPRALDVDRSYTLPRSRRDERADDPEFQAAVERAKQERRPLTF